jgi:hypothetical protein
MKRAKQLTVVIKLGTLAPVVGARWSIPSDRRGSNDE